MQKKYVGAIDQGTTSTRFIIFNRLGEPVGFHQLEHRQIFPKPGWVEHDPEEIWMKTCAVIKRTLETTGIKPDEINSIGITNQRETTIVWDRKTGKPFYNALVWQDTRTARLVEEYSRRIGKDGLRKKTGLPIATYFSAPKLAWLLDNVDGLKNKARNGEAVFGTVDTWLLWNLTRGGRSDDPVNGPVYITDVTNAGRTLLMDLSSLSWDKELLDFFGVPEKMLPEIRSSVAVQPYGLTAASGPFGGEVPISGILGDQQAAMFGQACFSPGESKNTYGTGCFFLFNTGEEIVQSRHGLIATPFYKDRANSAVYALEGSVSVAGSLVQWLRDNLNIIKSSSDIEELAARQHDSGGIYIVPAFSGLFAPYWRSDARGVVAGLTGYANASHLARAVLESTAFQIKDIINAIGKDSKIGVKSLKVDGGMTCNSLLMQFQADLLDLPVIRPVITETTALGAAYASGLSTGFWTSKQQIVDQWAEDRRWLPAMDLHEREKRYHYWLKAVERTLNWKE